MIWRVSPSVFLMQTRSVEFVGASWYTHTHTSIIYLECTDLLLLISLWFSLRFSLFLYLQRVGRTHKLLDWTAGRHQGRGVSRQGKSRQEEEALQHVNISQNQFRNITARGVSDVTALSLLGNWCCITASTKLSTADTVKACVHLNALFISACCDVTVISMLTPCATSQGGILGSWHIGRKHMRLHDEQMSKGPLKQWNYILKQKTAIIKASPKAIKKEGREQSTLFIVH